MEVYVEHYLILTIVFYLIGVNLAAFILYGVDKRRARLHRWRISESGLILFAWIGGAYGAICGMKMWHHKTQKVKFKILIPLACVVWFGVLFFLFLSFVR